MLGLDRPGIDGLDEQFTVNIDHHATSEHFGTINWIDSTASAVGEMIYNLCKAIGGRVTQRDRRMRLHGARHRHRLIPFFQHNRPNIKGRIRTDQGRSQARTRSPRPFTTIIRGRGSS